MVTEKITYIKHEPADVIGDRRGMAILNDPRINKGTGFDKKEREKLGLRGLIPSHYVSIEEQLVRVYENYGYKTSDLQRYIYLMGLQDRNETLFYKLLENHLEEMMPIVYTPTVGLACQKYSRIFRRPRGLSISLEDTGHVDEILGNWPYQDIRIIVVTDGERILGLGDLGLNGMGIPVGKLNLYVAAAGIDPVITLPVCIDVGTDNEELLNDPLYLGLPHKRARGPEYDDLIEEFMMAVRKRWPRCIIQFEDFGNKNAFRLLEQYRLTGPVLNDDIQGTGSVTLAGILGALRLTKEKLIHQRFLFQGAGEAGVGIASAISAGLQEEGLTAEEARQRFWFVDSKGLVTTQRGDKLAKHKLLFARDEAPIGSLLDAINQVKPTALIGVSGQPQTFTETVVKAMASHVERPIIFALSNPTSKSECTAEQAYTWTEGKAIFASGSPFDPVEYNGRIFHPGQGNNAYIFPGVGLGAIVSSAKIITDSMFHVAAITVAEYVTQEMLDQGSVYPPLGDMQEVSILIGIRVAEEAYRIGLNTIRQPDDIAQSVRDFVWTPDYKDLV